MRHRRKGRVLGRSPSHQRALLRNLASALMLTERETEAGEVGAQFFVQAGLSGQPVGGEAVNAGALELAHKHRRGGAANDAGQALAGALQ